MTGLPIRGPWLRSQKKLTSRIVQVYGHIDNAKLWFLDSYHIQFNWNCRNFWVKTDSNFKKHDFALPLYPSKWIRGFYSFIPKMNNLFQTDRDVLFVNIWVKNSWNCRNFLPVSGTSVGRMILRICSIDWRSGLRPPWQQNIFSSTMAAIGRQLKQSVNVFHSLILNLRLPEKNKNVFIHLCVFKK